MTDERLKIWLGFVKFLLGTFALGLVTTFVNQQIQQREIELQEQQFSAELVNYAVEGNVGYRRALAQYFATVTRSDAIRERWQDYLEMVERQYQELQDSLRQVQQETVAEGDDAERDSLRMRVLALQRELQPSLTLGRTLEQPRVYMHIAREGQRAWADSLAAGLRARNYLVPGIEQRDRSPSSSEVRYFHRVDREGAESLAEALAADGVTAAARYVAGYESLGTVPRGQYEVWLAAGAGPG